MDKELIKFLASMFGSVIAAIFIVGCGIVLYKTTVERSACAAFAQQNPDTKVFFSVATGCQYKMQYYWNNLR
jgi:hypothetical protein